MATPEDERTAYDVHARERWAPEARKRAGRSPFERDRARVVHSSALRRLGAKTQVHGPGTDDFVRTRLTHSLEVAQVGRELGRALGCDPDVVETACLAHDLGHPPFGHNGERALDAAAAACGGFEGNAQTLRLLTRLEAKTFCPDGRSAGLNLTRASLDASTKYPWHRGDAPAHPSGVPRGPDRHADGSPAPSPKFGAYDDDAEVFRWLRADGVGQRRCIEAQVMDWADDVAYSVHDVEDGIQSGALLLDLVHDRGTWGELFPVVRGSYAPGVDDDELAETLTRLLALPEVPSTFDGSLRGLAALKTMTSALVGRFTTAVEVATRQAYGPGRLTRHAADLHLPRAATVEVALLKGLAAHWVMRTEARVPVLAAQRTLLVELVELLLQRAPAVLEPPFRPEWAAAPDDAARLRVVIDQTASLTDGSALAWRARLGP